MRAIAATGRVRLMKTRSSRKGEIEWDRTGKEKKRANPLYLPPPRQPWSQYKKITQHSLRLKQLPPRAQFASSTLKRAKTLRCKRTCVSPSVALTRFMSPFDAVLCLKKWEGREWPRSPSAATSRTCVVG